MVNVFYKLAFPAKNYESFKNKKHVKIPYKYRDKEYVYLLKKPKMIMPIEFIKDENDKDITDEVYPYLGPNLDCHNVELYHKSRRSQYIEFVICVCKIYSG